MLFSLDRITFGRLQTDRIGVSTLSGAVECSDACIVQRVEVKSVHRADCFFPTVHFLFKGSDTQKV
jgi:hypothetical protein